MSANRLGICYVADLNFLYPTLLSIISLRKFVGVEAADIFVFFFGKDEAAIRTFSAHAETLGVTFVPLRPDAQPSFDASKWHRTHVSHSALGRFFIDEHLSPKIERVLYIDGDTLFVGDPSPLLAFVPPEGTIAAAEDISWFCRNDGGSYGRTVRHYFNSNGIDGQNGYFNSGVLLAGRSTWRKITREAADYFVRNVGRCRYHDQSALNAVAGSKRVRLSPEWNFQTPFRYWGIDEDIIPKILHFTQFPKPWMGPAVPWIDVHQHLAELERGYDTRALPRRVMDQSEMPVYNNRNLLASTRLRLMLPFRLRRRRRELRELMQSAVF